MVTNIFVCVISYVLPYKNYGLKYKVGLKFEFIELSQVNHITAVYCILLQNFKIFWFL